MDNYHRVLWQDIKQNSADYIAWEKLYGKNVLLTGATGLIMSYFVYALVQHNIQYESGIKIYMCVHDMAKGRQHFEDIIGRDDVFLSTLELDGIIFQQVKFDYIIHAASPRAVCHHKDWEEHQSDIAAANIANTAFLLGRAARDHSIFLFISSELVNGRGKGEISENQLVEPYFLNDKYATYAVSKRAGELLCTVYEKKKQVDIRIVRICSVYGPGENLNSGRCFVDFLRDFIDNKPIQMKGDGLQLRSFCYVMDAVNGLLTVLLNGENGIYNLGSYKNILFLQDLKAVFESFRLGVPYRPCQYDRNRASDSLVVSVRRLRALGWKEKYDIFQIIEKSRDSYEVKRNG